MSPYAPPRDAPASEPVPRPTGLLVTGIIIGFMSAYGAVRMPRAITSFEELFKEFGADLAGITRVALAMPWLWYLFAAIGIAIATWILARPRVSRAELVKMKLAARAFLVVYLLTFGVTAYAIYLPIFRLGAVV